MRWFWVDRFDEFVAGQYATSTKNVSMSEEHLDDYNVTWPYMPPPLMIEGLAQTGGLLLGQMTDFTARVVLAKLSRATFDRFARPGDRLTYHVRLLSTQDDGAVAEGTIQLNGEPMGSAELMFATLGGPQFESVQLFEPHGLLRMLRSMRLFEVGKYPDGTPIEVPKYMLLSEQDYMQQI